MLDVEYSIFKTDTVRGIRDDEEQYAKLQEEIQALESEVIEAEKEREARTLKEAHSPAVQQNAPEAGETLKSNDTTSHPPQPRQPVTALPSNAPAPASPVQPLHVSFDRTRPPPSPQRNDYGPVSELQGYLPGPPPHNARTLPHLPGLSPMHPPIDLHPTHGMTTSASGPGHGSPIPYPPLQQAQAQAQYQQYTAYGPPQVQWNPQQTYPQNHSPHAGAHFYQNSPSRQAIPAATTPIAPQYQYFPQSAPANHYNRGQQQPWQVPIPYAMYVQPASAGTTPLQLKDGVPYRSQVPGSSTPWKRKRSNISALRVPSPEPPRDVSPFSDIESPGPASKFKSTASKPKGRGKKQEFSSRTGAASRNIRRARAASTASSTLDRSSRSQSLTSLASDLRPVPGTKIRGSKNIKPEPTSTPAPFPSDSEVQRSSGRRRTRGDTLTTHDAPARLNLKRKWDSVQDSSPVPSSPPYQRVRRQRSPEDPDQVPVSKTFGRVAYQLLNRVTEHKFAGIFAKALSERDAPGYKNLIHRPQDLKSIKAAVARGSKAAIAAIDELEQETGEGPTTVKRNEDLVPPKGIVNMDQLEMELMRMFANAVMFNPLPQNERGLGARKSLRLLATPTQGAELGYGEAEEGGIVQDARDMCEDVVALIETFKAAEQDRMDVDQS